MTSAAAKLLNSHDRAAGSNCGWRLCEVQFALKRTVFAEPRKHTPGLPVGEPGAPSISVDDESILLSDGAAEDRASRFRSTGPGERRAELVDRAADARDVADGVHQERKHVGEQGQPDDAVRGEPGLFLGGPPHIIPKGIGIPLRRRVLFELAAFIKPLSFQGRIPLTLAGNTAIRSKVGPLRQNGHTTRKLAL